MATYLDLRSLYNNSDMINKVASAVTIYAAGIGALCTVITMICYIFFQIIARKKSNQSDKNLELIKVLEEKINKLDKG